MLSYFPRIPSGYICKVSGLPRPSCVIFGSKRFSKCKNKNENKTSIILNFNCSILLFSFSCFTVCVYRYHPAKKELRASSGLYSMSCKPAIKMTWPKNLDDDASSHSIVVRFKGEANHETHHHMIYISCIVLFSVLVFYTSHYSLTALPSITPFFLLEPLL